MTTGIRVKDPIIGLLSDAEGCLIEFDVKPFDLNGYFDGFTVELSPLQLEKLHNEIGQRLHREVEPVKERKNAHRHIRPKTEGMSSQFYGVHKDGGMKNRKSPWRAQIREPHMYLFQMFQTEVEAARKYNEWVEKHGLSHRPLNVIP
jgi:hypothetical protein